MYYYLKYFTSFQSFQRLNSHFFQHKEPERWLEGGMTVKCKQKKDYTQKNMAAVFRVRGWCAVGVCLQLNKERTSSSLALTGTIQLGFMGTPLGHCLFYSEALCSLPPKPVRRVSGVTRVPHQMRPPLLQPPFDLAPLQGSLHFLWAALPGYQDCWHEVVAKQVNKAKSPGKR